MILIVKSVKERVPDFGKLIDVIKIGVTSNCDKDSKLTLCRFFIYFANIPFSHMKLSLLLMNQSGLLESKLKQRFNRSFLFREWLQVTSTSTPDLIRKYAEETLTENVGLQFNGSISVMSQPILNVLEIAEQMHHITTGKFVTLLRFSRSTIGNKVPSCLLCLARDVRLIDESRQEKIISFWANNPSKNRLMHPSDIVLFERQTFRRINILEQLRFLWREESSLLLPNLVICDIEKRFGEIRRWIELARCNNQCSE